MNLLVILANEFERCQGGFVTLDKPILSQISVSPLRRAKCFHENYSKLNSIKNYKLN